RPGPRRDVRRHGRQVRPWRPDRAGTHREVVPFHLDREEARRELPQPAWRRHHGDPPAQGHWCDQPRRRRRGRRARDPGAGWTEAARRRSPGPREGSPLSGSGGTTVTSPDRATSDEEQSTEDRWAEDERYYRERADKGGPVEPEEHAES